MTVNKKDKAAGPRISYKVQRKERHWAGGGQEHRQDKAWCSMNRERQSRAKSIHDKDWSKRTEAHALYISVSIPSRRLGIKEKPRYDIHRHRYRLHPAQEFSSCTPFSLLFSEEQRETEGMHVFERVVCAFLEDSRCLFGCFFVSYSFFSSYDSEGLDI